MPTMEKGYFIDPHRKCATAFQNALFAGRVRLRSSRPEFDLPLIAYHVISDGCVLEFQKLHPKQDVTGEKLVAYMASLTPIQCAMVKLDNGALARMLDYLLQEHHVEVAERGFSHYKQDLEGLYSPEVKSVLNAIPTPGDLMGRQKRR